MYNALVTSGIGRGNNFCVIKDRYTGKAFQISRLVDRDDEHRPNHFPLHDFLNALLTCLECSPSGLNTKETTVIGSAVVYSKYSMHV